MMALCPVCTELHSEDMVQHIITRHTHEAPRVLVVREPKPDWVGKPDANGDVPCSRLAPKHCMWVEGHYGGCATR
jgi:hypothetical protein